MRQLLERMELMEGSNAIATEILRQIGGQNRVGAMIGVKQFVAVKNGLRMKFKARAKKGINTITIILNGMDTYDVEFGKDGTKQQEMSKDDKKQWKDAGMKIPRIPHYKVIKKSEGIYNDMLVDLLEKETGLYFRM